MSDFMIHFLFCNVLASGLIVLFLVVKRILRNALTSRTQYNMWFPMLGLLMIPFLPFSAVKLPKIFSWFNPLTKSTVSTSSKLLVQTSGTNTTYPADWMNDFTMSVTENTPSSAGFILCGIWITGIFIMILLIAKSNAHLHALKKSALPLQNQKVHKLYHDCLNEMHITKTIPIYSTAFIKSPIIVGLWKPCIYLPTHLISDFNASDMRYMLLHELQHFKYKDTFSNYFINFIGVLYWFNPIVWYALREMRNDREVACDTSVLSMLKADSYDDYGNTLIDFAEKISLTPFPFTAGLSGNMKQMKRRITNIATYKKPSVWKKLHSISTFAIITALTVSLVPTLSMHAADKNRYSWNSSSENVSYSDFSSYFDGYEGSFVLYDLENDSWNIYDLKHATLRVAPDSTYKIYDALFGLDSNIITPKDSFLAWDGKTYPFDAWNADQTLQSAINASVNWYFQKIDERLGISAINKYLDQIDYGNQDTTGDLSSYWMESSLKISPIEQVELLTKLYTNNLNFSAKNIKTVKDAILISSSGNKKFYGKTGTGRINGKDINGWFIGFVETAGHTCFFATNIEADDDATGSKAAEITMSILSDFQIWESDIGSPVCS